MGRWVDFKSTAVLVRGRVPGGVISSDIWSTLIEAQRNFGRLL
jgi:hypothetical protein